MGVKKEGGMGERKRKRKRERRCVYVCIWPLCCIVYCIWEVNVQLSLLYFDVIERFSIPFFNI